MTDKQFEALLGAISQLTLAIRNHTEQMDETLMGIAVHIADLNDSYKVANELEIEDNLGIFDTPIGGDGC